MSAILLTAGAVVTVRGEDLYNPFPQAIPIDCGDCPGCGGARGLACGACHGEGCAVCEGTGDIQCGLCNAEAELAASYVHGRGIPGFPEPTMCGEAGPIPHVMGTITCPRCVWITSNPDALAKRAGELLEQYGEPKEGARC